MILKEVRAVLDQLVFKMSYTLKVNIKSYTTFNELETGDLFTIQGTVGFGNIFIGFPIYIKTEENTAIDIIDSRSENFEPEYKILKVKLNGLTPCLDE
jgi:hypothetical protein